MFSANFGPSPITSANALNSSTEKCGVPRLTASSFSLDVVLKVSRASRTSAVVIFKYSAFGATIASRVGASGVTPTTWKSPTPPADALVAPMPFRRSSVTPPSERSPGSPTIAATLVPARFPKITPSAAQAASSEKTLESISEKSNTKTALRAAS